VSADLGALAGIIARKQGEAEELHCASAAMWAKVESLPPARDLRAALLGGGVIAEVKRRSPSGGVLREDLDPLAIAREYAAAGAAAISVLTDGPDFGGSLDDLAAVRTAVELPVLRKDFVVDPVQVAEARVAGADWVLLIAAVLDDAALDACLEAVRRGRCHAIVEVHDQHEAHRAEAAGADCIGINNRDLRTLKSDLATFARVRANISAAVPCVAESGIRTPDDAARMVGEGADAVLVGEALLVSASPADACAQMVRAARAAAEARS
jgi:indole-3-glycerol phosphate synthase